MGQGQICTGQEQGHILGVGGHTVLVVAHREQKVVHKGTDPLQEMGLQKQQQ